MKLIKPLLLAVCLSVAASSALAARIAPVQNAQGVIAVQADGKAYETDKIKRAITAGAIERGWVITGQSDGKIEASLDKGGKHQVVVDILYTDKNYSINYKSSVNLNETVKDGVTMVHPNYNRWVVYLTQSINASLARMQ